MSSCRRFVVQVLHTYSANLGESPREVLATMRWPGDAWEQASLVESLAEAPWRTLQDDGVDLPPSSSGYFLARPFDDGTARLIVLDGDAVISHDLWPSTGSLKIWASAITALAADLRAYAAARPRCSGTSR